MDTISLQFKEALLDLDKTKATEILLLQEKEQKYAAGNIIQQAMENIGYEWERGILALSQIYLCGRICEEITNSVFELKPEKPRNKTAIGITTLSDYHYLGKKIVSSILRSHGVELIDYGHGVSVENLVKNVINDQVHCLLVSALMLPSALLIKTLRELFESCNYSVKILAGGAPFIFDNRLWQQVSADAFGATPTDAISILQSWNAIE